MQADLKLTFPAKYKVRAAHCRGCEARLRRISAVYDIRCRAVHQHRTLKVLKQEIPHDRSEDYAAFLRVIKADEEQEISLRTTRRREPAQPPNDNESADELFRLSAGSAKPALRSWRPICFSEWSSWSRSIRTPGTIWAAPI